MTPFAFCTQVTDHLLKHLQSKSYFLLQRKKKWSLLSLSCPRRYQQWKNWEPRQEKIWTQPCWEVLGPWARDPLCTSGEEAFKCSRDKEILRNTIKVKCGDNQTFNSWLTGKESVSPPLPGNYPPFLLNLVSSINPSMAGSQLHLILPSSLASPNKVSYCSPFLRDLSPSFTPPAEDKHSRGQSANPHHRLPFKILTPPSSTGSFPV